MFVLVIIFAKKNLGRQGLIQNLNLGSARGFGEALILESFKKEWHKTVFMSNFYSGLHAAQESVKVFFYSKI